VSVTIFALATVLGLAAGQSGNLSLDNIRATYGILGPARPDNKVLPGDTLVICFNIAGVKPNADNKVLYKTGLDILDGQGKTLFRQEPRDLEAPLPAGRTSLPACATLQVGGTQPPGDYTVKVEVTDRTTGATGSFTRTYTLLPKGFGIVNVSTTRDADGQFPMPVLEPGKSVWINFSTVAPARQGEHGQPDVAVSMQVRDPDGRPLLTPAPAGEVKKDVPDKAMAIPFQFELELNRPGTFVVELQATDKTSGKNASLSFPVTVARRNR
jgi:hypothetical protein